MGIAVSNITLPTSFCGELGPRHLCQMTLILTFFEHELGNSNFPITVLSPPAAAEDVLACWRTLKSPSGPCCNWAVSGVLAEHSSPR